MVIKNDICVDYDEKGQAAYYRGSSETPLSAAEMDAIKNDKSNIYYFPSCGRFMSALRVSANVAKILIKEDQLKKLMDLFGKLTSRYGDADVNASLQGIQAKVDQAKKQIEGLEKADPSVMNGLKDLITKLETKIPSLMSSDTSNSAEITRLQNELNALKASLNTKTSDLAAKEASLQNLQTELDDTKLKLTNKQSELDAFKASSGASSSAALKAIQDQLTAEQAKATKLTQDIARLTQTNADEKKKLEDEKTKLVSDITRLTDEKAKLQLDMDRLKNEKNLLEAQSATEKAKYLKSVSDLEEEKKKWIGEKANWETEKQTLLAIQKRMEEEKKLNESISQKLNVNKTIVDNQIKKIEEQLDQVKKEYKTLQDQDASAKARLNMLYAKLSATLRLAKGQQEENDNKILETQDLLNELSKKASELEAQIRANKVKLEESDAKNAQLSQGQSQLSQLQNDLNDKALKIQTLEGQIKDMESKQRGSEELLAQLSAIKSEVEKYKKEEKEKEAQASIDRSIEKDLVTSLNKELDQLKATLLSNEEKLKSYVGTDEKIASLQKENEELKAKYGELEAKYTDLDTKSKSSNSEDMNKYSDLENKYNLLSHEKVQLEEGKKRLEEEQQNLNTELARIASELTEAKNFQKDAAPVNEDATYQKMLEEANASIEKQKRTIVDLEEQLKKKTDEQGILSAGSGSEQGQRDNDETQKALEETKKALEENERLKDQINILQENEKKEENELQKKMLEKANASIENQTKTIADLKEQLKNQIDNEETKKALEEAKKTLEENERLKAQIKSLQESSPSSNAELEKKMKTLTEEIENQKKTIAELTQKLETKDKEIGESLDKYIEDAKTALEENKRLKAQIESLQEAEKTFLLKKEEIGKANELVNELQNKRKGLTEEIDRLKKENDSLSASQFDLKCITSEEGCLPEIAKDRYKQDVEARLYFTSVFDSMGAAYQFQQNLGVPVVGLVFESQENKIVLRMILVISNEIQSDGKRQIEKREISGSMDAIELSVPPVRTSLQGKMMVLSFYNTIPSLMSLRSGSFVSSDEISPLLSSVDRKLVVSYTFYTPSNVTDGVVMEVEKSQDDSSINELQSKYDKLLGIIKGKEEELSEKDEWIENLKNQISGLGTLPGSEDCPTEQELYDKMVATLRSNLEYLDNVKDPNSSDDQPRFKETYTEEEKANMSQKEKEFWESYQTNFGSMIKLCKELLSEIESIPREECKKVKELLKRKKSEIDQCNKMIANFKEDVGGATRVYVRVRPDFEDLLDAKGNPVVDKNGKPKKDFSRPVRDETKRVEITKEEMPYIILRQCPGQEGNKYGKFYGVIPDLNSENKPYSNKQVFETFKPTIEQAASGYSIIFFGYGLSGSGKTYTLMNTDKKDEGLFQNTMSYFKEEGYSVKIYSVFEEYQSKVSLNSDTEKVVQGKVHLLYVDKDATNVLNTIQTSISYKIDEERSNIYDPNPSELVRKITEYRQRKNILRIKATVNNPESSRSHLYIVVQIKSKIDSAKYGYITFVDMAGRETPSAVLKGELFPVSKDKNNIITNKKVVEFIRNKTQLCDIIYPPSKHPSTQGKIIRNILEYSQQTKRPDQIANLNEIEKKSSARYKDTVDKSNIPGEDYKMIHKKMGLTKIPSSSGSDKEYDNIKMLASDYCNFVEQLIKESFYINESINHLTYFLKRKQNYKTNVKLIGNKDMTTYKETDYFTNPEDYYVPDYSKNKYISENNTTSNCLTIPIMQYLDKLGGGTPSKFVMLCAIRQETNYCSQTEQTLVFARNISSTKDADIK